MRTYPSGTLVPYEIVYAYCSVVYNSKKLETSVDVVGTNIQIMEWYAAVKKNEKASYILK